MFFNDLDQTGWRLSLQEPPKRIVSLVPSQTELLHNLGVMNFLVGRTKFCVHPNEIQTIPVVGGTKQIKRERLLEVNPDLVIGNHEENTKEDIEWIRESYPVWLSKVNSLKDAFSMIHSIGLLVNRLKEAQRITEKIKRVIPKKICSPKLSAAYLIWNKPMMVAAGNTFIDSMLQTAGIQNVFSTWERYPKVDDKTIRHSNADLLLLSSEPFPFREKHRNEFQKRFPEIRVCLIDGEMCSWYGNRMLNGLIYLNQQLSEWQMMQNLPKP